MGWVNLALFVLHNRRARNAVIGMIAGVIALFALLLLVLVSTAASVFSLCREQALSLSPVSGSPTRSVSSEPSDTAVADIPANYLSVYREAAKKRRIDWAVLAAVGYVETRHGYGGRERTCVNSSVGAQGPMQFMPSTWQEVGVDASGDGKADPCHYEDAIHSAAKYLVDGGAPGDYQSALFQYNNAGWYVDDVLSKAEEYRAAGSSGESTSLATLVGGFLVSPAYAAEGSGSTVRVPTSGGLSDYCTPLQAAGIIRDAGEALGGLGGGGESSGEAPTGPTIGGGPEQGKELVEAAQEYVGTRYVLGTLDACGPEGIDCDCLIYLAFQDIGAPTDYLNGDPQQYLQLGTAVEGGDLQAGDIIVYRQAGILADVPGGHVAIATGNGNEVVHAIPPETTVSPDYRDQGPVIGVRRLFGEEGSS